MSKNEWKDIPYKQVFHKVVELDQNIMDELLRRNGLKVQVQEYTAVSSHGRKDVGKRYRLVEDTISYMKNKKESNE